MSEFKVTDDKQANWALRKLREFREEKIEKEKQAEEFRQEIEEWFNSEVSDIDKSIKYFEGLLNRVCYGT